MIDFILHYWLEILFGIITSTMAYFIKKLNNKLKEQESLKVGVRAILRNELKNYHSEYTKRESITTEELDNFQTLYHAYVGLGGNGTGKKYYETILTLPIIEKEFY